MTFMGWRFCGSTAGADAAGAAEAEATAGLGARGLAEGVAWGFSALTALLSQAAADSKAVAPSNRRRE
jgi:hypothetical protein